MSTDIHAEATRQIEICNACRYCEGYCSVFPSIVRQRLFSRADITHLANLCHNCRGCYYACQYTEPHEFALNLPKILAEVRQDSWQRYAVPTIFASAFHRSGAAIALITVIACTALFALIGYSPDNNGSGFYALLSHGTLIAVFTPVFLLPLISMALSVRNYWLSTGGRTLRRQDISAALRNAATLRDLSGGHGEGCNFEDEDRFSNARRRYHQATLYGFLLCFAATSIATLYHYAFAWPAPYPLWSLPKLLGISGGVLLSTGTLGLAWLKLKADRDLADRRVWGGEMGFIVLLFLVSTTGLALYGFGTSAWLPSLLAVHLGTVLALLLLMPYSKMVHGLYRLAALIKDAQDQSR